MPLIVRWYLKTSLVYLVAALLLGIASSFQGLAPIPAGLGPVFIHLLVVGWITQLIFGVALWMFPKQSISSPRGSEWLAWGGYGLLNAGLVLRALGEPLSAAQPGSWAGWLLVISAVLQWLAGAAFALEHLGKGEAEVKLARVSAWAVRLALLYLVAGFSLGALMLANKGIPFAPWAWNLLPAHIDFLLFGFFIQFIIGVGFTMLPRFRNGERGDPRLVWGALVLLNLGIGLVVLQAWKVLPAGFLIVGRVSQAGAALVFLMNVWGRVRAFK